MSHKPHSAGKEGGTKREADAVGGGCGGRDQGKASRVPSDRAGHPAGWLGSAMFHNVKLCFSTQNGELLNLATLVNRGAEISSSV